MKSIYSSIRRVGLIIFKPMYIKKQLKNRRGSCKDCKPSCCFITRPFCPFLKKNGLCKIYNRFILCYIFPIDEKDIELAGLTKKCKFHWVE